MVTDMEPRPEAMAKAAGSGYSIATDLADWLVRETGLPFREAHHVTGRAVAMAESRGCGLEDLSLAELQSLDPKIIAEIFAVLSVQKSVASRKSFGGTAPANVREQVAHWRQRLASRG
ncbi:MAG: argininosuccinate lyase, partial [Nitratireductor sp.]|nr:argininosuccinate lyase [Nitratireductor sp.]